nr:MAG TPA: hypothetical protein [Caudoviricetes sp.]
MFLSFTRRHSLVGCLFLYAKILIIKSSEIHDRL